MKVVVKDGCRGYRGETTVNVSKDGDAVKILPEGYGQNGEPEGEGGVVFIDRYKGKVNVRVFADINDANPTFEIDLDKAKESARVKQGVESEAVSRR